MESVFNQGRPGSGKEYPGRPFYPVTVLHERQGIVSYIVLADQKTNSLDR